MITSLLFIIVLIPLTIIHSFLSALTNQLNNIVPNEIYEVVPTLIGYLGYFKGVFPVDTLLTAIGALISFFLGYYIFKIAMWVWSIIPWIGKNVGSPTISQQNTVDLRDQSSSGRTVNLKRGKIKSGKIGMKDIR